MIPHPVPQLSSPRIVRELMETGRRVRVESGATLFREGDPVTDVFCVAYPDRKDLPRRAKNGFRENTQAPARRIGAPKKK